MTGLTNNQQAFILALSAFFLSIGAATATIPELIPEKYRIAISMLFWICGIIGFALKELTGSYITTETK